MNYKELRALLLRRFSMPKERSIRRILRSLTIAEKAVFYFLATVFLLSGIFLLWKVSDTFLIEVPSRGGTLTEGVVGNPRFINPVLAISEADKNLVSLLYSGPVRITPEGKIENDLAEEVTISDDRRTYTVRLREGARFHDDTPVTADDLIFTIQKMTDPSIKSPKRGNWDGITLEKIDEKTVSFILKQAYTPFIYNLTVGILPRHIWKNVSLDEFSFSQFNTLPIGSGPYKVKRVERNPGGIPNLYELAPFEKVSDKVPFIKHLVFRFYPSEVALVEAFNSSEVESIGGISPEKILELQTLDLTSPKEEIIEKILGGYATAIAGPMPAGIYSWTSKEDNKLTPAERLETAKELLAKAGWQANPETGILEKKSSSGTMSLSFSISTSDAPELQQAANELVIAWEKLGAKVDIVVFEIGELNQSVIRPRNFQALLFGEIVGRDADLYPFWHSSQRADPGLNIALYANSRADKYLDNARSANNPEVIEENYKAFAKEVEEDVPAVFLYTPSFLYIVPEKIEAISLDSLTVSQDRFLSITDWYIETDKVWKIFVN
ncbi:MAG: AppA [Parcubacteria group bacterium GW2011_GWA2_45_15]|nr:MAG: AppA [Parcubacteria group bacterium GW2011_GWA2_45_15]